MPFQKGNPKTIEAGRRGGKTGKKHLELMPKDKLRKLSRRAGKISGERRRQAKNEKAAIALTKKAIRYEDRIMRTYFV